MQDRPLVAHSSASPILGVDEPPPVAVHNAGANSPFLLVGDHAGNRIPACMLELGIDDTERSRHIAWDIGIADLGVCLADKLGAPFIHQIYSRLVIDCNRRPGAPDSIPPVSDGTIIPGNSAVDAAQAELRAAAIHAPYQKAIAEEIDRRATQELPTFLVALHSFTPAMGGLERPWHAGILYDGGDNRFAQAMLKALADSPDLNVGDNEPYSMDTIDFTIPFHAYPRALPYVEIEIRQDLLADTAGIGDWCGRLEQALVTAKLSFDRMNAGPDLSAVTGPMPESRPRIELRGLSFTELQRLADERRLPPVDRWDPPHCGHSGMRITSDGTWLHEGEPITRGAMVRLFATILRREPDGSHVLVTPVEKLTIEVDATAFRAVEMESEGAGETRRIAFRLDSGDVLILGPDHPLSIFGDEEAPRLLVRHGLEAALSRPVYYELAELALAEANRPAGVWSSGTFFPLAVE